MTLDIHVTSSDCTLSSSSSSSSSTTTTESSSLLTLVTNEKSSVLEEEKQRNVDAVEALIASAKPRSLYALVQQMDPAMYNAWVWRAHTSAPHNLPLFETPFMDALSQAPWWHPMAVWLPILYATGAWVDPHEPLWGVAVRFFWGLVLWSVTEYGVHRFLFHLRPQSKALVSLHFLAHGYHHLLPLDGVRLVMPTTVAALVGLTTLGFLVLWYGSLALALASWWGFASGYIVYDTCHYWLHSPFVPQWRWAEELRRRHMAHHYGAPDRNFAISPLAKLWDMLWGTY